MGPLQSTDNAQLETVPRISALFVHDHGEHLLRFEESLKPYNVELTHARNCEEASHALQQGPLPLLVFTDTRLSDGTFQDVLKLAANAEKSVNVLVVSKVGNMTLYMDAMERGAFDFLTPNMEPSSLRSVFLAAVADVNYKRSW